MKSLCVFCGASAGRVPAYRDSARAFGETLGREGIELVWGAGNVGLMGAVADGVLAAGGRTFGVIPDFMVERELAHGLSSELHVVTTMHERKARMAERADAFVALPGGFGTLDELFEVLTLVQTRKAQQVPIVLFGSDYWRRLLNLQMLVDEGAIALEDLDLYQMADSPEDAWDIIGRFYGL